MTDFPPLHSSVNIGTIKPSFLWNPYSRDVAILPAPKTGWQPRDGPFIRNKALEGSTCSILQSSALRSPRLVLPVFKLPSKTTVRPCSRRVIVSRVSRLVRHGVRFRQPGAQMGLDQGIELLKLEQEAVVPVRGL